MAKQLGEEITLLGMIDHGRTELAASLLRHHDGHVMYMQDDKAPDQGKETMSDLREYAQERQQEMDKGREGPEITGPEQDHGMDR